MIVLDASAAVELALGLPLAGDIRDAVGDGGVQIHAPHLLIVEVLHVLRRRVMGGVTTVAEAGSARQAMKDLDVSYHDHLVLFDRIWRLRENLTAYDAAYVALAELLGATLLTVDARLARAPGHSASVDLVAP